MNRINLFYLSTILLGILLFILLKPGRQEEVSFYGFAENEETEINYNYPVVVERIMVKPGQSVKSGDTLVHLYRQERQERLQDQDYRISLERAEEALWIKKKQNQIRDLEMEHDRKISMLEAEIKDMEEKLNHRKLLVNNLQSIKIDSSIYTPLQNELHELLLQKELLISGHQESIRNIRGELNKGMAPYHSNIKLFEAEKAFEASQKKEQIVALAPSDGLIGTISCKEAEHIPSFKTLLTFYEPHSRLVKGYVHEDFILNVKLGDHFKVVSLKDSELFYDGKVIGLGSRIVEIPSRLRKIPDFKTYGREVLVEISSENEFLQKEKVGLYFEESRSE